MSTKVIKKEYDNESISSLKGAERVRKRPSVIFGSDGLDACEHSAFEIVSNSIDEAREGHGDTIIITLYEDHSIEVEDFGRGCPVDYNQAEGRYNWELVFCELYAGGKYKNNEGSNYEYSLGLNGLGACATQYTSEYMDVTVWRDGNKYSLHFEKGENIGGLTTEPTDRKKTGSRIRWKPDIEVFTDVNIPAEYFVDTLKRQAVVNAGITFKFRVQRGGSFETNEFKYERGIEDYVEELAGDMPPLTKPLFWSAERKGRDREDRPEYKVKMSVCFCFTNTAPKIEYYHNSSWLEYGGAPDKAVRNAFVYAIDNFAKQHGKYQKNESKISFVDVFDSLLLVSNNFSTIASYENQTKKAVTNKFVQEAMTEFLRAQLEIYFIENRDEATRICDQVLVNKRSRESAEKERLNIKKKLSAGNLDITSRIQKFIDCRTKDRDIRELYIVEGDSAAGACKQGRSAEFQAIMPVRGKILNCLKADLGKIFNSDIIVDLVKVLGCGVEVESKKNKDLSSFDLAGLRWKRVIICTDADVDGFQIRTLILTMIYRLMPQLIRAGYVYIAESPLYEITSGDDTYFAYSDAEKNEIVEKLGKAKYTVQRSKGLGENEPDMMWQTTMNPETRRLIKVVPDMAEAAVAEMFDLLLGDNLAERKQYIAENGWKYLDEADVS